MRRHRCRRHSERVTRGEPALLARCCSETGIANDVAGRKDIRYDRAELVVDLHTTTVIGGQAHVLETERAGCARASDRKQCHVGDDALPDSSKEQRVAAVLKSLIDRPPHEAKMHILLSHLVQQLVDDLGVDESVADRGDRRP
jgi:hypothetical protein